MIAGAPSGLSSRAPLSSLIVSAIALAPWALRESTPSAPFATGMESLRALRVNRPDGGGGGAQDIRRCWRPAARP